MLNKIIHFSLQNRLLILSVSVLLLIAGIYTARTMDVDVFPDLNAPTVVVMTEAQGMAPEEVERLVTFPVETSVNGATGVRRVRSSSTTGFSVVWVEFEWGTDIYRARQIVSEKVATIRESLPPTAGVPTLGPQSSILGEIMILSLTSDSTSLRDLRTLADWTIRPRLLSTGGVAQVSVLGGDIKEYQVLLSPARMKHLGISLDEVMPALRGMNRNSAGGILYQYGNEYIIRGILSTHSTEELGAALIRGGSSPVLLRQIADVRIGSRTPKMGVASERTHPAVMLTVTKQPGAGTLDLTHDLDETLTELRSKLPPDVKLSTDIYRQERFINSSIDNVKSALLEGGFFVVIILFVFLMDFRTTLISLVTIPISLVVSILTLHAFGLTINTMSLGGMAIAIGSLVDDAIVDVENVHKRLKENRRLPAERRRRTREIIFDASREVRLPILNSTLIIIVSFVPLFFLSGMEGRLLVPLGIAFITALCASTLVALTLTPVLCSFLLGGEQEQERILRREPFVSRKVKEGYTYLLTRSLRHRREVLIGTGALLFITLIILTTLGRSFLPPFNEGSFTINVTSMPGVSLEESDKIGRQVEQMLLEIPEIHTVGRKTGRAELDEHSLGVNTSEIEAPFTLSNRSKAELIADIRHRLSTIKGINVEVGSPITHRIDAMLSGTRANIAIKVFGEDLNRMYAIGNAIKESIEDVEGIRDLNVEPQVERPQLQIIPRRTMLAQYGVTLPEFADMVSLQLAGEVVSTVNEGSQSFDLVVKVNEASRATIEDIRMLTVDAGDRKVPLSQIARIRSTMGPNTINRENVKRKLVVSANVEGRDLRGAVSDIRNRIDSKVSMPEGYHVEYGGQFESEAAASRILLLTSLFSILVIFLLLYHQFRDLKQSALILLNLPLALIGGVLVIRVTDGIISIPAIIGFISLFGIATRNGMLLVSRYNDLRSEGVTLVRSIVHGSIDRLNPILMTALTSALALIPLVWGGQLPGNEIQSPMAKVILGGLITSTLLNGFLIPIIYLLVHRNEDECNIPSNPL